MSVIDIPIDYKVRQVPRVVAWDPQPGKPLPMPLYIDDREQFPIDVVKDVLMWLEWTRESFVNAPPTPITITLRAGAAPEGGTTTGKHQTIPGILPSNIRAIIDYCVGAGERLQHLHFRHGTIELLLREKGGKMLWGYHYLAARDQHNRVIVGPFLRLEAKVAA